MTVTMRAAVLVSPGELKVMEVPAPEPAEGELLVRMEGCGVCASNVPLWEGRDWFSYPISPGAPGHEGWGTVAGVGPGVDSFRAGDRVALLSYNAYAEFDKAPAAHAVMLPPHISTFPGESVGCAFNIFRRSAIAEGDTVAVIGIGFLGALLTSLVKERGGRVLAISRRPFSLELARDYGADAVIPMDDHWRILERVKELTGGRMCRTVIEATGQQWPLDLAGELAAERGRVVIAGYHQDGVRTVNMQMWNWKGLDVVNAHERDPLVYVEGMRRAVEAVASGCLDISPLCTHAFALDRLGEAYRAMVERPDGFLKAMITL